MPDLNNFFRDLYKNFNDRKIDLVISKMTADIKWANGMEGGYVHDHYAVRDYWTRQFTMVSSNVTSLEIESENGMSKIKVHQVVHDLNGNLLADAFGYHFFISGKIKLRYLRSVKRSKINRTGNFKFGSLCQQPKQDKFP